MLPTVPGREGLLQRVQEAYAALTPVAPEFLVMSGFAKCGAAWIAGARLAAGEYLHFGADDLEPSDELWCEVAVRAAEEQLLPTGLVVEPSTETTYGPADGFARVPFLSRTSWQKIETLPRLPYLGELHYYSDVFLSELAAEVGIACEPRPGYDFLHHRSEAGRIHDGSSDAAIYTRANRGAHFD